MPEWVFGIDGGGTSSRIRAESMAGEELYHGADGSTNLNSNDAAAVTTVLARLVSGAIAGGLDPAGCRAGFIGSAGVDLPEDRATMAAALAAAFSKAAGSASAATNPVFGAGNDAEPALVGALADVEGYLLIAGTGSIALGRTESGTSARAGGWGHWLGDEGSAFWLAFEAIKAGLRASEGRGPATALGEAALEYFGLSGYDGLVGLMYAGFDKAAVARFAVRVEEARALGDPVAVALFDEAARELAALAASVYDRFGARIAERRIALYGGLMDNNFWLKTALTSRLRALRPELEPVTPLGSAEEGACILARSLLES